MTKPAALLDEVIEELYARHTSNAGVAAVAVVGATSTQGGGRTLHLLAGLNADQYAAEMRGQLAET